MRIVRSRRIVIGLFVGCALAAGCGEDDRPLVSPGPVGPVPPGSSSPTDSSSPVGAPAKNASPAETTEDAGPADDDGVALQTLDWEATEKLIAGHKGKIVVVDIWSTACVLCRKEFPHLVELHKKYEERVACISVNCDYLGIKDQPPESYREDVLDFLRKKEATFDNVLSSVESDALSEKLGFAAIPVVYVYGKDGKLAKRFDNEEGLYGDGFTYREHVIPLVEKLLEDSGKSDR